MKEPIHDDLLHTILCEIEEHATLPRHSGSAKPRSATLDALMAAMDACQLRGSGRAPCALMGRPVPGRLPSCAAATPALSRRDLRRKLSGSEMKVLEHLAEGRKVSEIAALLSRSPKTISAQKVSLMRKLNATTNLELHQLVSQLP